MRRLGAHIAFVLVTLLAWLLPAGTHAQAVASWNETTHDYGTFHEIQGNQSCSFLVTNTGDSALLIVNVKSTCGCTVAQYTTELIEPGNTGRVDVTYSPTGRPGPFTKTVWVYTNTSPERTGLSIKGIVLGTPESVDEYYPEQAGDLRVTRTKLAAGEVVKGLMRNSAITAYNATTDTVVLAFDNNTSHITIRALPDTIAPGGTSTISFFFYSARTPLWGINDDTVTMITRPLNSTREPKRTEFNLVANVVEEFSEMSDEEWATAPVCSLSAERIVLDKISSVAETTMTIENTGQNNLVIHRVMSLDNALSVKCDHTMLRSGEKAIVTIKVDPARMPSNVLNSQFTVISNDPANPRITMRVVGEK